VRLLRRRRRPFSVAGRSGPAPITTGTVQRREPTLSLTKYRGSRPVTLPDRTAAADAQRACRETQGMVAGRCGPVPRHIVPR